MEADPTNALVATQRLVVRQAKEWGEILTDFEGANRYSVADENGATIYLAAEKSEGVLALLIRSFLKSMRPFEMQVVEPSGRPVLRLNRPFRFFFHRLEIADAAGKPLGAVQKRWSWIRRVYDVETSSGRPVLQLFGPLLRPWTFQVLKGGREAGKIQKKWSGLLKEAFSDADNFGVELSPELDQNERLLLVGAVFLIDFVHFEDKGRS